MCEIGLNEMLDTCMTFSTLPERSQRNSWRNFFHTILIIIVILIFLINSKKSILSPQFTQFSAVLNSQVHKSVRCRKK